MYLHVEANAPDLSLLELRGYYDKINVETFKDVRTLDINSVLTADIGYELNNYLPLSVIYRWYWLKNRAIPVFTNQSNGWNRGCRSGIISDKFRSYL
ncbi:MAG: hypothetical protein R3C26_15355 [Calditrichia bacterium]